MAGALLLLSIFAQPADVDEARIKALIAQLGSEFLDERKAALAELHQIGAKAEPALVAALASPDGRVQYYAILLLNKRKSQASVEKIGAIFMGSRDQEVRAAAFDFLCGAGPKAEPYLVPALDDLRGDFRKRALDALIAMDSKKACDKAAELYERETDADIKSKAFDYLVKAGKDARHQLLKLLRSPVAETRSKVLGALRGADDPRTYDAVVAAFLAEKDGSALSAAYRYLTETLPDRAAATFTKALKDGTAGAQTQALDWMIRQKSESGVDAAGELFLSTQTSDIRAKAISYLKDFKSSHPYLKQAVKGGDGTTAVPALKVLREAGNFESVIDAGGHYATDGPRDLRAEIVRYLKLARSKDAEKYLVTALDDAVVEIRKDAIEGLAAIGTPTAVARLTGVLASATEAEKQIIVDALTMLKADALEILLDAPDLIDENREQIRSLYTRMRLEETLDGYVVASGGTGSHADAFKALGDPKLNASQLEALLLDMAFDRHVYIVSPRVSQHFRYMRELAVMALGTAGGPTVLPKLQELREQVDAADKNDMKLSLKAAIALATARRGDDGAVKGLAGRLQAEADELAVGGPAQVAAALDKYLHRAMLLYRAGDLAGALAGYEALEKKLDGAKAIFMNAAVVHYNLACVYARRKELDKAMASLNKAVAAGWSDGSWLSRDDDLKALRGRDDFKTLVAKLTP